jgi:UDP-N-acetylglucosamine acyltransferase
MKHPTAVIHPDAELANAVEIGPYAVIEGPARIGAGCVIQAHAIIGGHVAMGERNLVGYGAVIGADPQDFAFKPDVRSEVRIGNDNRIREYTTIHRGTTEGSATIVGDHCFLMAGTHLGHNVRLGNHVVIANNSMLGGYVQVEDRVFIGGGCVFHQFIRVGRLAICQGASGFSKDIPPFTMAAGRNSVAGLNVVGLRRAGIGSERRMEIKAAFTLLYRSGLNVKQALAAASERSGNEEVQAFWDFVRAAGKRGLCDFLGTRDAVGMMPTAED